MTLIHDPAVHLTGKLPPRYDERTLKLARYLDLSQLPTPPGQTARAVDHHSPFQMFGNDSAGDCTFAGIGNAEEFWASLTGRTIDIGTSQVIAAYASVTGYDPKTGANDNGAVELDVLKWWRQTGLVGHKIDAFAAVNLKDEGLTRTALYLFDGLYLGVALPVTAQSQEVWDYEPQFGSQAYPGSWGGHCIFGVDYNATGPVAVTWGGLKQMTWAFWANYVDEAYAILTTDDRGADGRTIEGYDVDALTHDLRLVAA